MTRYAAIIGEAALIGLAGGMLLVGGVKMWFLHMAGDTGLDRDRAGDRRLLATVACSLGGLLFGGIEALVCGSQPPAFMRRGVSC